MPAGPRRHLVTLSDRKDVGSPTVFVPPTMFVALHPGQPIVGDEDHVDVTVEAPYHPQVTTDTVLLFGTRRLIVQGVTNVDERGRDMVLLCQETKTP